MPIELGYGRAVILIRQSAFEKARLVRSAIDARYNLTDEEFRAEDGLVILGPLPSEDVTPQLIDDLESAGLTYFEDFFDLSGNWPEWLSIYVRGSKSGRA
jgi:hypothetical protein